MQVINNRKKSAIPKSPKNTTFYLYEKASNKSRLRVLYKQNGKNPRVRIIPNVQILKRAIVNRTLDIIPYQNVFLICNNQDYMKAIPINVVFDFFHVSGDLLVIKINKETREFESLSQEDIAWYTSDLIYRSFNPKTIGTKARNNITNIENYLPKREKTIIEEQNYNFETALIQTLTNMELTLASLLATNNKNE